MILSKINKSSFSIFQSLKLDLDFKDEKISSLNKELEDLHTGGASEEEVATLKKQKHELEMRLKEEVKRPFINDVIQIDPGLEIHRELCKRENYDSKAW